MQNLTYWERSYSVGNWMLDNQHRNIMILCQQTIDRIAVDQPFRSAGSELLIFTGEHFSAEERLLAMTGYATLEHHREEHRRCLAALEQMLDDAASGRISPEMLGDALSLWCVGHILDSDRQFSPFIQRRH